MTGPAIAQRRRPRRRVPLDVLVGPAWPVQAILLGYPIWWALGLSAFVLPMFAVPMATRLWRRRPIRLPPGFRIWAAFIVVVLASAFAVGADAPQALRSTGFGPYLVYANRTATYLAVTILLLYVGNLTEKELSRLALVRMVAFLCIVTIVGGLVGTFMPRLHFTSVTEMVLPRALTSNSFVRELVHPRVAQNQDILGATSPRPSAPYVYTNDWGHNLSLQLVWLSVGWAVLGSKLRRIGYAGLVAVAVIPIVYSLNRGLWVGLAASIVYVAFRLALRRNTAALRLLVGGVVIAAGAFVLSPLSDIVEQRAETPHSNQGRLSLFEDAVRLGTSSPIIGYGGTRDTIGSGRSIAIGPTEECPQCGERVIGSAGQITLVLVSQGLLGATLYVAFFAYAAWYFRNDHSVLGIAGGLVLVLPLLYMWVYNALAMPLAVSLLAVALLWRNERVRAADARASVGHRRDELHALDAP